MRIEEMIKKYNEITERDVTFNEEQLQCIEMLLSLTGELFKPMISNIQFLRFFKSGEYKSALTLEEREFVFRNALGDNEITKEVLDKLLIGHSLQEVLEIRERVFRYDIHVMIPYVTAKSEEVAMKMARERIQDGEFDLTCIEKKEVFENKELFPDGTEKR